jgi:hypothetical protein
LAPQALGSGTAIGVDQMTEIEEIALRCMHRLVEVWQIDPERMQWVTDAAGLTRGFEWWPGDYRVDVLFTYSGTEDEPRAKISCLTRYLKDIDIFDEKFELLAGMFPRSFSSTYSPVYPPATILKDAQDGDKRGVMYLSSSIYIDNENSGWMTDLFAGTAIIQPVNAQIQAGTVWKILNSGQPDIGRPPELEGLPLDNILETMEYIYAPIGKQPNRFVGTDEFEQFVAKYGRLERCFGTGDQSGLTLETSFGTDSALIRLITDQPHPQLGNGLLAILQLPYSDDEMSIARSVAVLNFTEAYGWTGFPQIGSWHSARNRGDSDGLAFTLFMPNALCKPMLVTNVAFWLMQRAEWAKKTIWPGMTDLPIWEIIENRLGQYKSENGGE